MTSIDAHQHFWRPARGDYGWLTPAAHPQLCRDFLPEDLAPLIAEAGVERTMLVQAAPSEAETRFLLDVAAETPFVAGVVGWTDLADPRAPERVAALAEPKLVGLRPMLQDLPDDAWIARPALRPALEAMIAAGLALDALVSPRHLPFLRPFLVVWPGLRVVIDHGAKPDIAGGELAAWAEAMGDIARESRAFCKLSGLVTEAGPGWTLEQLKPVVDVLLEAFGPGRLIWGSDWPVVEEAGGYLAWRAAAEALTGGLAAAERAAIFGGAAESFYRLRP